MTGVMYRIGRWMDEEFYWGDCAIALAFSLAFFPFFALMMFLVGQLFLAALSVTLFVLALWLLLCADSYYNHPRREIVEEWLP